MVLYRHYQEDPQETLTPEDILEHGTVDRKELFWNLHYLHDCGLVEMMLGFNPMYFDAARITARGIDLVENHRALDLYFPAEPDPDDQAAHNIPFMLERIVEEGDLCSLDGEARQAILQDVRYLREELSRPARRWRREVVEQIMDWLAEATAGVEEGLPTLPALRACVREILNEAQSSGPGNCH